MGAALVRDSIAARSPYRFAFHVLADPRTINAFALPGGPVFITEGLLGQLKSEAEPPGCSATRSACDRPARRRASSPKAKASPQGLIGAATVGTGDYSTAQIGQMVGSLVNMRYGPRGRLESDALGIRIMAEAGYDPRVLIGVMETLAKASSGSASLSSSRPIRTPRTARRASRDEIARRFPSGVPAGLKK